MTPAPPPMKFWELVSAFRSSLGILREVLNQDEWRPIYGVALGQFDQLCEKQARDVLDALIPLPLSRAVAALDRRSWAINANGFLSEAPYCPHPVELLTTLEVHDRFGGSVIEEVCESGCTSVVKR